MEEFMNFFEWKTVNRKRSKCLRYTDNEFVQGYDVDVLDIVNLSKKVAQDTLTYSERERLGVHIITIVNIVFENPKIRIIDRDIKQQAAERSFIAMWKSLDKISEINAFSYLYTVGFNAWKKFARASIAKRRKNDAICTHINECTELYINECSSGKTPSVTND